MTANTAELNACTPVSVQESSFNNSCNLPYGLEVEHVRAAMEDFVEFLGFVNTQLHSKDFQRLESFIMPANFSSMVGEFMNSIIPRYCKSLARNNYHNGHPDLVPRDMFANNAVQHATEGIEIKGSRRSSGWQGHNPESVWLMVYYFDSNSSSDSGKGIPPKPFRFVGVYAAKLVMDDWSFSGRSGESRRTITASVLKAGVDKMKANWVFRDSD
ncbi:hypothetical protein ACFL6R_02500 [Gemmatimonadota bacterium]